VLLQRAHAPLAALAVLPGGIFCGADVEMAGGGEDVIGATESAQQGPGGDAAAVAPSARSVSFRDRAPAPLTVAPRAGGHTEWFRGIGEPLRALAERLAERYGHQLHAPLKSWLRERLQAQAELLYGWSSSMHALLVANELHGVSDAHDRRCRAALVEAIDACDTVGLDLQAIFPAEVLAKVRP